MSAAPGSVRRAGMPLDRAAWTSSAWRSAATLRLHMRRHFQEGFWLVALLAGLIGAAFLLAVGAEPGQWWRAVVLGELCITSFYFAAVQVLRERGDGTLAARAVSPLRTGEYLGTLAGALALIACAEIGALVLVVHGPAGQWALLGAGVVMISVIYSLYGVCVVVGYRSVSAFLMPSGAWTLVLGLPLAPLLGLPGGWWLWLHPLYPALVLVDAAFTADSPIRLVAAVALGCLWVLLAARIASSRLESVLRPCGAVS